MKHDVAVIGMSVNLPGINTLNGFWDLILSKKDLVDTFPVSRQEDAVKGIRYAKVHAIKKVGGERVSFHNGNFLPEVGKFDHRFFNMTPKQALTTDPQQRLLLKTLYWALEDAGYAGERLKQTDTGVFIGYASNPGQDYSSFVLAMDPTLAQVALTGNIPCMLSNRFSHFLDIRGPSTVVDCACSASLVATMNAARSVADGYCSMALVGGTRICVPISDPMGRLGIESSDGKTRTFDQWADGTGLGEGSGAVVLKRLDQALADGDPIYSVIKGGAINHDGTTDGLTTPNSESQARLLQSAWQDAGIHPSELSYIEAHGTATKIGDPIEVNGMKQAFAAQGGHGGQGREDAHCALGTVKTNIGHLFEASGVMGLIKTSLSLHHKVIAPIANYQHENPLLQLSDSPFYVSQEAQPWEVSSPSKKMGVSAFGLGGTNCHVVLEEAPQRDERQTIKRSSSHTVKTTESDQSSLVFVLSAMTEKSLQQIVMDFRRFFADAHHQQWHLRDVCATLLVGRRHLPYRLALSVCSMSDLLQQLSAETLSDSFQRVHAKVESESMDVHLMEIHSMDDVKTAYLQGQTVFTEKDLNRVFLSQQSQEDIQHDKVPTHQPVWNTVNLPCYSYDETEFLVRFPDNIPLLPKPFTGDGLTTYHVNYVECPPSQEHETLTDKHILLFDCESSPRAKSLNNMLKASGNRVTVLRFGEAFDRGEDSITMSNNESDYQTLGEEIKQQGFDAIIHLTKGEQRSQTLEELQAHVQTKLMSLFFLSRALMKNTAKSQLWVITENIARVGLESDSHQGLSAIVPENAALSGYLRVLAREATFLTVKGFDLDAQTSTRTLVKEIGCKDDNRFVIYRHNQRFIEQFEYLDIDSSRFSEVRVREGGNYLITGGTGGIGLEVAKYLAKQAPVNLFLVSRSGQASIEGNDYKQQCIQMMKDAGSTVTVYPLDCGLPEQISAAVDYFTQQHGDLQGIVHAAGNPGQNIISLRETSDFEQVIHPKIQGTYSLFELANKDSLDFMVLFSSVASIFPSAGQADYAAANAYMDAFAALHNNEQTHVAAIQWVAWDEVGMAVDSNTHHDNVFKTISNSMGIDCFDKTLRHQLSNVFVGEINYADEMVKWMDQLGMKVSDDIAEKIQAALAYQSGEDVKERNTEPEVQEQRDYTEIDVTLTGRDGDTYTETEIMVGKIWSESLGYDEFHVQDEFIKLGGESITAMTISRNLSEVFDIIVDVSVVMRYSHIESLSGFIDEELSRKK